MAIPVLETLAKDTDVMSQKGSDYITERWESGTEGRTCVLHGNTIVVGQCWSVGHCHLLKHLSNRS